MRGAPRAVVLDALAAQREPALRERLGADADDALRGALRERARAWARNAGGGAEPLELAAAADLPTALRDHGGPVLLVAPDVPTLSTHHLAAVHADLAAGVLLSSAATGDGTPFLVALSCPEPALLALVGAPFDDLLAAAADAGRELGMIRAERRLASLADARALQADPLAPPDLLALLARLG
ncbi:MAG TPA: hypothetical protein VNT03_07425 [Baekduia sp.]|nr:hypothetical protein [Baekduia sp.]